MTQIRDPAVEASRDASNEHAFHPERSVGDYAQLSVGQPTLQSPGRHATLATFRLHKFAKSDTQN